jgi:hypothetical protein
MIEIDNTITSLDVVRESFCCDLSVCKGACCVEGDGGAPLEAHEVDQISADLQRILPYLTPEGRKAIEKSGIYYTDSDGDMVTTLVDGKECAFVVMDGDVVSCGIEKAFNDGVTTFRKPISCHLYPVRIAKYSRFEGVNYHRWDICKCARTLGKKRGLKVYQFLQAPLVRKYGQDWFNALDMVVKQNNGFVAD